MVARASSASIRGSSPLTRGKRGLVENDLARGRLIPAHAGKTSRPGTRRPRTAAHPRSRGENVEEAVADAAAFGSSPLTRGKQPGPPRSLPGSRLIPAHAGKTLEEMVNMRLVPAHPRSRGENTCVTRRLGPVSGSSPLTRGKLFLTCAFIAQIDQILESLELCASSGSYSLMDAYATDAPQDRVRSIGLAPLSSRGAS